MLKIIASLRPAAHQRRMAAPAAALPFLVYTPSRPAIAAASVFREVLAILAFHFLAFRFHGVFTFLPGISRLGAVLSLFPVEKLPIVHFMVLFVAFPNLQDFESVASEVGRSSTLVL